MHGVKILVGGLRHGEFEITASHAHEEILDVDAVLGTRLEEGNVLLVGEGLSFVELDHTLVLEICLVSYDNLVHVFVSVLLNLSQPVLDVVKGLLVRDIVHKNVSVGSAVVSLRDRSETLLSCSIPLQFASSFGFKSVSLPLIYLFEILLALQTAVEA